MSAIDGTVGSSGPDDQYLAESNALRADHEARITQLKKLRDLYDELVRAEDSRFNDEWTTCQRRAYERKTLFEQHSELKQLAAKG